MYVRGRGGDDTCGDVATDAVDASHAPRVHQVFCDNHWRRGHHKLSATWEWSSQAHTRSARTRRDVVGRTVLEWTVLNGEVQKREVLKRVVA